MSAPTASRPGGRPREFDLDEALERAMEVFWRQGYEGTSLGELTAAMGINRPSLYAAFGNKEALFRKALDRYVDERMAFIRAAIEEPTARRAVEALLRGYAASVTNPGTPPGLARYISTIAQGLAVQAAGGASRKQLNRVVDVALHAWPD